MINGIKPNITKKTLLDVKTPFGEAMDKFLAKLTENGREYIKRYKLIDDVVFKIDGGTKFLKVKHFETNISTDYETGKVTKTKDTKGSIHCFVDKNTGDIYKPAGWKSPYTKGNNAVRGSIYDESTFEKTDLHGGWLYAK